MEIINMPTKEEKIKAFVEGRMEAIMTEGMYTREFWKDVKFADIIAYAEAHGIPETICNREVKSSDGLYLVQTGDSWKVYLQERGGIYYERYYKSEHDAKYAILALNARSCSIEVDEKYAGI